VSCACGPCSPVAALTPRRASKTVTVTFFPRFRKPYALQLRCRSANATPMPVITANRPPSGSGPGALRLPPLTAEESTALSTASAPPLQVLPPPCVGQEV
jgi:hypothetical protein